MSENPEIPEKDYSNRLGMTSLRIAICYADGYSSLKFLDEILGVQINNQDKFLTFPQFFNYLYGICFQSVVINLSNIIVEDKESINIYYLKSFFENHTQEMKKFEDYKDLYSNIQEITNAYSKECEFYQGLKELRDKYIAHIDKARFNAAAGPKNKISLEDIRLAYAFIGDLVGRLIGSLGINPDLVDFEQLEKANLQFRLLVDGLKPNPVI